MTEPAEGREQIYSYTLNELGSGIRVVTESVPSVRSIALGFWVRVGSRDEDPSEAGISHFLEHLLFKGTERLTAEQIAQIFDTFGADVNAATSKETTVLYAHFLDEHLDEAFGVMADMLLRSTYADIDAEREVVLEEIAMYEDEPQDKVHDVLSEAIFGDHPLGRPVIGRREVISSLGVEEVSTYHDARYTPSSIVVAAAGNLEHEAVADLAQATLQAEFEKHALGRNGAAPDRRSGSVAFQAKETEQYHICLGGLGIQRDDERRFALSVLDAVLGGSTSSRLFQEVREKRGLAYSIYSWASHYRDTGQLGIYVGTRRENVTEAMSVIGAELDRLQEAVSDEELARAREHVKGRIVLSMESTANRMHRLGRSVLTGTPLLSPDEVIARLDAVDRDQIEALAREFYVPDSLSAAAIGKDEELFRDALGAVNAELAAAG